MKVAASPRSMAQVAAVLAFVISHTTFFSAQDDEMRRTTPAKPSGKCQVFLGNSFDCR